MTPIFFGATATTSSHPFHLPSQNGPRRRTCHWSCMFSHALHGPYFLRGQLRTVLGARFVVKCSGFTWPLFSSGPIPVRSAGLLVEAVRCITLGELRAVLTIRSALIRPRSATSRHLHLPTMNILNKIGSAAFALSIEIEKETLRGLGTSTAPCIRLRYHCTHQLMSPSSRPAVNKIQTLQNFWPALWTSSQLTLRGAWGTETSKIVELRSLGSA